MSSPLDPSQTVDVLDQLIAAYMEAVDKGDVPNRQELLAKHPEHAEALQRFFADMDKMDRVAAPLRMTEKPGPPPLETIRYFGDYELLEEIARGGMGIVYKARQKTLNRIVALKLILAGHFASPKDVERFHIEAEAAANLDHPNIVPVYEIGEHEKQHYLTMKLIEGVPLDKHPRGTPREEVSHLRDVARAVQHAHEQLILHRDLKPSNILVDASGQYHVADFGLAKRLTSDGSLTDTGQLLGTPRYMSPEQAAGNRNLTVAADVYSLGVILFERLCGRPPFVGDIALEIVGHVIGTPAPKLSRFRPKLGIDLNTIVDKCLQKEPSRRYKSAEEFADDLDCYLFGRPISARPIGQAARFWSWCRRNPVIAGLAIGIFLTLSTATIGMALLSISLRRERDEADRNRAQAEVARNNADERLIAGIASPFKYGTTSKLNAAQQDALWELTGIDDVHLRTRWIEATPSIKLPSFAGIAPEAIAMASVGLSSSLRMDIVDRLFRRLQDENLSTSERLDLAVRLLPLLDYSDEFVTICQQLLRKAPEEARDSWCDSISALGISSNSLIFLPLLRETWRRWNDAEIASDTCLSVLERLPSDQTSELAALVCQHQLDKRGRIEPLAFLHFLDASDARRFVDVICDKTQKDRVVKENGWALNVLLERLGQDEADALRGKMMQWAADAVTSEDESFHRRDYARIIEFTANLSPNMSSRDALLGLNLALQSAADRDTIVRFAKRIQSSEALAAANRIVKFLFDTVNSQAADADKALIATSNVMSRSDALVLSNTIIEKLEAHGVTVYSEVFASTIGDILANVETTERARLVQRLLELSKTMPRSGTRWYIVDAINRFPEHLTPEVARQQLREIFDFIRTSNDLESSGPVIVSMFKLIERLDPQVRPQFRTEGIEAIHFKLADSPYECPWWIELDELGKHFTEEEIARSLEVITRVLEKDSDVKNDLYIHNATNDAASLLPYASRQDRDRYHQRLANLLGTGVSATKVFEYSVFASSRSLFKRNSDGSTGDHQIRLLVALLNDFSVGPDSIRVLASINANIDEADKREVAWQSLRFIAANGSWNDFLSSGEDPHAETAASDSPSTYASPLKEWLSKREERTRQICLLSTEQIVELLKYPTVTGKTRRRLLDSLENRYKRRFDTLWDFVRYVEREQLGLDFTSIPSEPSKEGLVRFANSLERRRASENPSTKSTSVKD